MIRPNWRHPFASFMLACLSTGGVASGQSGDWTHWGADERNTRYVSLDHINSRNFGHLQVMWVWPAERSTAPERPVHDVDSVFASPSHTLLSTPIHVEGRLLVVTDHSTITPSSGDGGLVPKVVALDPENGEILWHSPKLRTTQRDDRQPTLGYGITYGQLRSEGRVYVTTPGFLHALSAASGQPISGFGNGGTVTLREDQANVFSPIVVNHVVVVGGSQILAYDALTGEQAWSFRLVPQWGREFGWDTWGPDTPQSPATVFTAAPLSADSQFDLIYVATGPPTYDFPGTSTPALPPGDNLFGTSVIALDSRSGERLWHFQTAHHDTRPNHNVAAPTLLDIQIDNKLVPLLMQAHNGFAYVFDRRTGEPIWPIEELPIPRPNSFSTYYAPTQPVPTWPNSYAFEAATTDVVQSVFGPASGYLKHDHRDPIPCLDSSGAGAFGDTSVDSRTGIVYILSPSRCSGLDLPKASVTAIDLNTGATLWALPPATSPSRMRTFSLVTETLLLYITEEGDGPLLRAANKTSGESIGAIVLPAPATNHPISYMHDDRQYVVVPTDSLVALAVRGETP